MKGFLIILLLALVQPAFSLPEFCRKVGANAVVAAGFLHSALNPTPYVPNHNIPEPAKVVHVQASANHQTEFEAFAKQENLTVSTFNVLNLAMHVGRFEPDAKTGKRVQKDEIREKDKEAIKKTAETLRELTSDIIFLQEVEDQETLDNFMKAHEDLLGRKYIGLLIEANDSRGIDVAVMIRADLGLEYEYVSHQNMPWHSDAYPERDKVFSRDATALIARRPGNPKPLFIILNTHSKSKRTEIEGDPESYLIREGQGHALTDLKAYYEKLYPGVPIMLAGDMNNNANTAPEYAPLKDPHHGNMKDAFDLVTNPMKQDDDDRVTHTYHPLDEQHHELPAHKDQMDIILVNDVAAPLVKSAKVHKYHNDWTGQEYPSANTFAQRKHQPSDHRPVRVEFDLQKLLKVWSN